MEYWSTWAGGSPEEAVSTPAPRLSDRLLRDRDAGPGVKFDAGMGPRWATVALLALVLPGCPTVDLGDTPPDIGACNPPEGVDYFIAKIYLKISDPTTGCARNSMCHDQAHGLALSRTVGDDMLNYRVSQGYLNCGQPKASEFLTRPLAGIDGHGGGDLFTTGSTEYTTFLGWFDQ
jgi:hypothetical protein